MQSLSYILQFFICALPPGSTEKEELMAVAERDKTVHISNSTYLCLDAGLPCSNYFLKITDRMLAVVDRRGNEQAYIISGYQLRYFNVLQQLRTVEHTGNYITLQAARYFDSRETGITFYIDAVVALLPGTTTSICVNGMSLMKTR